MGELSHLEAAHAATEKDLVARGDTLVAAEAELEQRRGALEAQIEAELARRTAELDARAKDVDERRAALDAEVDRALATRTKELESSRRPGRGAGDVRSRRAPPSSTRRSARSRPPARS